MSPSTSPSALVVRRNRTLTWPELDRLFEQEHDLLPMRHLALRTRRKADLGSVVQRLDRPLKLVVPERQDLNRAALASRDVCKECIKVRDERPDGRRLRDGAVQRERRFEVERSRRRFVRVDILTIVLSSCVRSIKRSDSP